MRFVFSHIHFTKARFYCADTLETPYWKDNMAKMEFNHSEYVCRMSSEYKHYEKTKQQTSTYCNKLWETFGRHSQIHHLWHQDIVCSSVFKDKKDL